MHRTDNADEKKQFVYQESLYFVFQDPVGSLTTNVFCSGLLCVLLSPDVDAGGLLGWFLVLLLVSVGRTVVGKQFARHNEKPLVYWHTAYAAGTLLSAAAWGSAALVIFPDSYNHQLYLAAVIAGVIVGAGHSQSPFPGIHAAYMGIMISPLIIRFFISNRVAELNYAVALFLLLFILTANSRKIRRIVLSSFELRYEISRMAVTDPLTRLPNRRRFNHAYDQEWQRGRRRKTPLSLLMIDVDHFKEYNDMYGHPAGDHCLLRIADAITYAVNRPGDIAARYGGEEFAVILPETPEEGARTVAERVRAGVTALDIPHKGNPTEKRITISIGIATRVPLVDGRAEALISEADTALYQAKASGRNRISVYRHAN